MCPSPRLFVWGSLAERGEFLVVLWWEVYALMHPWAVPTQVMEPGWHLSRRLPLNPKPSPNPELATLKP